MSVLDRSALEDSPLADLHTIASELGIDGFRRLRREALIDRIIERQGGENGAAAAEAPESEAAEPDVPEPEAPEPEAPEPETREPEARGRRAREPRAAKQEELAEGTVELLGGGSGFVRLTPPEPSDKDVYISAAQVRRCELVSGDVVSGPVRQPRRSERYPSLVRVDTINGTPADQVAAGTRYDDLPCTFPTERLALGGDDPTLQAIESWTPFGKGSRVVIAGPAYAGKSEALRRIMLALAAQAEQAAETVSLDVRLVLAGCRPEEVAEWRGGPVEPAAAVSFSASPDTQSQTVETVVEQARRVAARGRDVVVLIDGLDGLHLAAARRALASARNLVEGGSLTVIATKCEPIGGETTVIALSRDLTATARYPALDLRASGTVRAELLVGEDAAAAIANARAEQLAG